MPTFTNFFPLLKLFLRPPMETVKGDCITASNSNNNYYNDNNNSNNNDDDDDGKIRSPYIRFVVTNVSKDWTP
ncbi:hypothetical protein HZH68_006267 [Vespula germanica]|uniref:Uncharacterized protein n=1 Tax=Vespula germanica TaxID=30212 RepID=A0A834NDI3_VESGE|nr:hypothetical protein HZH68_006267 [Vespula germanica]